MTADELQHWAGIFRWAGVIVTAVGVAITVVSHFVADRLVVVQRSEKAQAQERLKVTEVELEQTKTKTIELTKQLAPRTITAEQEAAFLTFVANTQKGKVEFHVIGNNKEAGDYVSALKNMLAKAGFEVSPATRMFISTGLRASGVTLNIKSESTQPAHAGDIQKGLESIGIPTPCPAPGPSESIAEDTVGIYVGAKQ